MPAVAEERDLITRNRIRVNTRDRKLKTPRKRPIHLDTAEQIAAILDAAADLGSRRTLRLTFTSIMCALGKDPAYVMGQLRHTDTACTLRVYAHAMRAISGASRRSSTALIGRQWAHIAPRPRPRTAQHAIAR